MRNTALAQRSRPLAGLRQQARAIADSGSFPVPVLGWDASSPLENMNPAAAIILDNWFPEPAFVRLRAGSVEQATTVNPGNDSFTKVLLHMDGADASTTFTDSNVGGSAHTWTANGNAQIDTAQSKFGGASGLFDGTGDYIATPDHADFTLGSGEWTIDFWLRPSALANQYEVCGQIAAAGVANAASAWRILINNTTFTVQLQVISGTTITNVTGTTTLAINTWYHVAVVHAGSVLKLFVHGVQEGGNVAFSSAINNSTASLAIGRSGDLTSPGSDYAGWLDEFRLSVGVARWTADFTPPMLPYSVAGGGPIESLMAYHGPGNVQRLFAARGSVIYDVTATGSGTEAVLGLTNARWQHINFTTPGGSFLFIVNGADDPRHYNGTVWATPVITGITASQAVHVNAHKNRIWFVLINSTKAAYLPTSSIAGAAQVFDLGPLMTMGGHLVAMATWTMDSGWGPDDFAVFVTSKGQVIVYAGTDPASEDTWILKGVYDIGPPIGRRCLTKVGGDLAVITMDGVVSLAQAISMDRSVVNRTAITAKIQRAINQATRDYGENFGWQLIVYPKGTATYLNVPLVENQNTQQYVMNTLTGAWCRYIGQVAFCWEIFQDRIFYGGMNGRVFESDRSSRDDGQVIVADMKIAFNYFKSRGYQKRFTMVRALMTSDGQATPTLAVNVDYQDNAPETVATPFIASGARWNQFDWNDGSLWSGSLLTLADWISITGIGYCASIRMKVAPENENPTAPIVLAINGFDVKWERAIGAL